MAGNFHGVLSFVFFCGSFANRESFHPRKLMSVQQYVRKADIQGA